MTSLENYIRLHQGLSFGDQVLVEVSLKGLSELLFCTDRNSKLIVRKMEAQGWVKWNPGRGRGRLSTITFLQNSTELILQTSKDLVRNGNIQEAKRLIANYEKQYSIVREKFDPWFHSIFGLHEETVGDEKVDTLRLRVNIPPIKKLDPIHVALRSECHLVKQICDTLVRYNPLTQSIEPHLALHWDNLENATKWIFYLRKGIYFHNGKELKATDVEFTFKRALTNAHPYHWMINNIESVKAISEYVVMLQFRESNYLCLHLLSDERLSILNANTKIGDQLIGTGPFKLSKLKKSMVVLSAHHPYFKGRPFLDVVELLNMEDDTIDDNHDVRFGLLPEVTDQEGWRQKGKLEWNVQYISLNLNKSGPLQDAVFRSAFVTIIDRVRLVKEVAGPREEVAYSFLHGQGATPYDQSDPMELVKNSDYNGETLQLYTFPDQDHVEDVTWIQKECIKYGIVIEPHYVSADELLKSETIQKADIMHDSASMDEQIEISMLHLFLAENSFVHHHLSPELNLSIQEKVMKLYQTSDPDVRLATLKDIEGLCLEARQVIPLYRNRSRIQTNRMVQEAILNSQGWMDFYSVWFKKSRGEE